MQNHLSFLITIQNKFFGLNTLAFAYVEPDSTYLESAFSLHCRSVVLSKGIGHGCCCILIRAHAEHLTCTRHQYGHQSAHMQHSWS
jgi:hypothetical protein